MENTFWTRLAFSSSAANVALQLTVLLIASAFRIRRLIDTRIGGMEVVEIRSWPRLAAGVLACNGVFILMHHLYLAYGPSPGGFRFIGFHFLITILVSMSIIPALGLAFDAGKAIRVVTSRFKPEHHPLLIDMTEDEGRSAQLIPRGAMFAYQLLMYFTWFVSLKPR